MHRKDLKKLFKHIDEEGKGFVREDVFTDMLVNKARKRAAMEAVQVRRVNRLFRHVNRLFGRGKEGGDGGGAGENKG